MLHSGAVACGFLPARGAGLRGHRALSGTCPVRLGKAAVAVRGAAHEAAAAGPVWLRSEAATSERQQTERHRLSAMCIEIQRNTVLHQASGCSREI